MKKHLLRVAGSVVGLSLLVYLILAYLVMTSGPSPRDGLGRELVVPPWYMQFITNEPRWAGLGWHVVDLLLSVGLGGLAIWLLTKSDEG